MDIRFLLIVYALMALNVFLAARVWALSARLSQKRWAIITTILAVALSAYVIIYEGDGDLTPLGAIAAGISNLAVGMWVNAWQ